MGIPTAPPKWFTPARLLAIFCCTNLMVYLDRGLIASNGVNGSPPSDINPAGTGIQGAFRLSYIQDGLLPTAFMLGLLIASPIFAEYSKHTSAFRLLGLGMGVWTLAAAGCGASWNFGSLMFFRAFVGVGEASFVALAAPFIDDYAPAAHKTQWFAFFYLCIPVGFALGYIVGGVVTAYLSWRWTFVMEAAVMVPFVIFTLVSRPVHLRGSAEPSGTHLLASAGTAAKSKREHIKAALSEFWSDVKIVLQQKVWVTICAAYTCYVAVLGVYSFWGPTAGKVLFSSRLTLVPHLI
ncbi:MAG: hypothetical protein WDW36_003782 [Sanguina aurantia]